MFAGELGDGVVDREQRAGSTDGRSPTTYTKHLLDRLQLLAGRVLRRGEASFGDFAVRQEPRRHGDAAHVQALHHERLEAAPQDEFGAAAADVHDQPRFAFVRRFQSVRNAQIDQPRLFAPADDFHTAAKGAFRRSHEVAAVARLAQRIGADHAHVVRRQMPKPLPKTPQTRKRPPRHRRRKLPRLVKPFSEPHHLLMPIHHLQPTAIVEGTPAPRTKASNDQVEAVGAKVQRGVRFIERLRRLALLRMGVRGHDAILTGERACSHGFVKAGTHCAASITPTLPS